MADPPKISVIMPSYNHARYVTAAIHSVWQQDYPNLELIVVDDCSPDNSRDVLEDLLSHSPIPMTLLHNERNLGWNKTENRAIAHATGELIAVLASDDMMMPGRFRDQADMFMREPELKFVYANGQYMIDTGPFGRVHGAPIVDLLHKPPAEVLHYLYTHVPLLLLQTILVKRDFLLACGGCDESVRADDWVLAIRMFEGLKNGGSFRYLDRDVFYYRLHDNNHFRNALNHTKLMREVLRAYTPRELLREARGNIYWEISENFRINGYPWRRAGYFLLSSLFKPELWKAQAFLNETPGLQRVGNAARAVSFSTIGRLQSALLGRKVRKTFVVLSNAVYGEFAEPSTVEADPSREIAPLFDDNYYTSCYPDVAAAGIPPREHFCRFGFAEKRNPNSFFDTGFYLNKYPDVAASGINPLLHYIKYGAREGRDPHPCFSTSYYLGKVTAVRRSGLNPLLHYLHFGAAEGIAPHPVLAGSSAFLNLDVAGRLDGSAVAGILNARSSAKDDFAHGAQRSD